ncbi:hypothetical protein [Microlunatus elymi]|uniref:hypothetical protein n=1 Tax=Microlunatus elymi TaxID=2596828 RepID=UPI001D18F467|nr:hypothetical protein [Microlunatus elymi]
MTEPWAAPAEAVADGDDTLGDDEVGAEAPAEAVDVGGPEVSAGLEAAALGEVDEEAAGAPEQAPAAAATRMIAAAAANRVRGMRPA